MVRVESFGRIRLDEVTYSTVLASELAGSQLRWNMTAALTIETDGGDAK